MHRPTVGLSAVVLLLLGGFFSFWPSAGISVNFGNACLRIGLIVGLIWFAQPQLKRYPAWLLPMSFVSLLIGLRWPKLLLWLILAAIVMYVIDPHKRGKPAVGSTRRKRDNG